jgi:hypothetical protein
VSLGLFGRVAVGASTDAAFWRDADGMQRQHGPLRLHATVLLWPLLPFGQAPHSAIDNGGGSHFVFQRGLRVGFDFQQALRVAPFDGANALGLATNLSTLRMVVSKGLGPFELTANGGALFDRQGNVATGTVSGQVGVHLPFFQALKVYAEGGVQGFGARGARADAVQRQGAFGGGLAFRLRDRVDVAVTTLRGVGPGQAEWTVHVRFLTLSVGESYQGRAATPIVELGADLTIAAAKAVREYLASLPIDPKLNESCAILDHDQRVMGAYGKRTAEGHYCEVDGVKVPIGHDFYRPSKTKDLLCSDHAMTECVLVLREGTWVGIRRVILNEKCRLIDLSDQSTLHELGHPSGDGLKCRWESERPNGKYAPIREWNELPIGTRLYADGAKSRVCTDPRLSRCVVIGEQLAWNVVKHLEQGVNQGGKDWANDNAQTAKNAAGVVEDVATGKVSVGSLFDAAVDQAVKTCHWMLDGVKTAWNNKERFAECVDGVLGKAKEEATTWWAKPTGDKVEGLAGGATKLGADAVAGVVGGKVLGAGAGVLGGLRTGVKVADTVEDVVDDVRKVRKGVHGVAEHTDDVAARGRVRKARHDAEGQGGVAEHDAPVLPVHASPMSDRTRAHIFEGEINRNGDAKGWHHEPSGQRSKGTYVIEETRSAPDPHGVYTADVVIEGKRKNGFSTFFPQDWSQARIEAEIVHAYKTGKLSNGSRTIDGYGKSGIKIRIRRDQMGNITTAHPIIGESE